MRSHFIQSILLSCAMLVACAPTQQKSINQEFRISGYIADSNLNGKTVFLSLFNQMLDSTVVKDGKFIFSGKTDSSDIARIDLKTENREHAYFILEAGDIIIDLNLPLSPGGTPLNDEMNVIANTMDSFLQEFMDKSHGIWSKIDMQEDVQDLLFEENYQILQRRVDSLMIPRLKANDNNALGAYILWTMSEYNAPRKIDSLYRNFTGENVRNNIIIKSIINRNDNLLETEAGKHYKDFPVYGVNDEKAMLSSYIPRGKYVLLGFWASWCGVCAQQYPYINEVYKKYAGEDFEVVGIVVMDEPTNRKKMQDKLQANWPLLYAIDNQGAELYGIVGIPMHILIGPDGKILKRGIRGEYLEKELKHYFGSSLKSN